MSKLVTRVLNSMGIKPVKVENSTNTSKAKASGAQDQGVGYQTNQFSSHPLDRSNSEVTRAAGWEGLYYKEWTARKIIDIPVGDALRGGWKYSEGGLTDEQARLLAKHDERLNFPRSLRQSLKMERLLGGAVDFMGIAEKPGVTSAQPVNPALIQKGDLQFINPVPRTRVSRTDFVDTPLSPDYNTVEFYYIGGAKVHRSRLLVFDGDPITQSQSLSTAGRFVSQDGFGTSVLAPIWDDIMRSVGTRQAAFHLINRASVLLMEVDDLKNMLDNKQGKDALNKLDEIADQLSMYQAAMVDKNSNISQLTTSFGSVPELLDQYLQIISAASDIPATRFLGVAPGGLNATGESDLENYYNSIEEIRENKIIPRIRKYLNIAVPSVFGQNSGIDPNEIKIEFQSLWQLDDVQSATVRQADSGSISTLVTAGIITGDEAISELRAREVLITDETDPEKNPDVGVNEVDDTQSDAGSMDELRRFVESGDNNLGGAESPQVD